jgi:ATP-dependent DNA ligase
LSARSLVIDGEVAIYDQQLRSRFFDWLREPDPAPLATPPALIVFDLLHRDGRRDVTMAASPKKRTAKLACRFGITPNVYARSSGRPTAAERANRIALH